MEQLITFTPLKGKVKYSVDDGANWDDLNPDGSVEPIFVNAGQSVKFKGSYVKTDLDHHFIIDGIVSASGCVDSLRLNSVDDDDISEGSTFQGLRARSDQSGQNETLTYSYMFSGCTNLKTAPSLKAMDLCTGCYRKIFEKCNNLTTPPVLPATSLAQGCYSGMFYECRSLTSAPLINVPVLAPSCYKEMFKKSGIVQAPLLPATTLANNCYESMFEECGQLTEASPLIATSLADECYKNMFTNCSKLKYPPIVSADLLGSGCYDSMFSGNVQFELSDTPTNDYKYKWVIKVVEPNDQSIDSSDQSIDSKYGSMFNTTNYQLNLIPDENGYLTLYSPDPHVGPAFSLKDIIGKVDLVADDNPIIDNDGYISAMTLKFADASDGDILFKNQDESEESEKAYIVIKDKDKSPVAYSEAFSFIGEHKNTIPRQRLYIKSPTDTSSVEEPEIWDNKTPAPYFVFIDLMPTI